MRNIVSKILESIINVVNAIDELFDDRWFAWAMVILCATSLIQFIEYILNIYEVISTYYPTKSNLLVSCFNALFLVYWIPVATKSLHVSRREAWRRKIEGGTHA